MTVETLKPFIKAPVESPAELKRYNGNKTALVCHSVVLSIFYVGLLGFVIWNSVRVANLQKEVKHLNILVDTMQKRLGFDLLEDLNEFEEAYSHGSSDDKTISGQHFFDDDPDDYNSDLNGMEDDEDEDEEYMDDVLYGDISEEEDLERVVNETRKGLSVDSLYDGLDELDDFDYKLEKEMGNSDNTDRKTRSVTSKSGVPIVEESYLAGKNKTDQSSVSPTMKYDWNEKREQYLERKHKKYMEMRSRPGTIHRAEPRSDAASSKEHTQSAHQEQTFAAPLQINYRTSESPFPTVLTRPNRVMSTNEDKSQAYRQDKASSYPGQVVLTGTRRRAMRPIHKSLEIRGRQRSVAAHYVGDTSRYTTGHHRRYEGNGRLRHAGGVYVDWSIDPSIINSNQFFHIENGIVTVHDHGVYLIYAQIFYHDAHDTNGFRVEKNGEPFLLCSTMTHSNERVTKSNTCYTSGVTVLRTDDNIRITDLAYDRHVILDPIRSFFGLVKIGPVAPAHHGPDNHDEKTRVLDALKRSPKI